MVFSIVKGWFGKRKGKSPLRTSHLAGTNSSYSIDDQGFESGKVTRYGNFNSYIGYLVAQTLLLTKPVLYCVVLQNRWHCRRRLGYDAWSSLV